MPVNVKLLKRVRKLIAEEPKRLHMSDWGTQWTKDEREYYETLPPCGTSACLAGWTLLAAHKKSAWRNMFDMGSIRWKVRGATVPQRAAKLLGLAEETCPFTQITWDVPEVLAWIDRQIDAAQSK